MSAERVLVTGGTGFIGSHLVERLLREGFEVSVVDDLSTGQVKNLVDYRKEVDLHIGDIRDLNLLQRCSEGCAAIFHLAALTSVVSSIKDPLLSNSVNLQATLNCLLAARDNDVRKVIFSSSAAVYGQATQGPLNEKMPPLPMSPYAVEKLGGEGYCRAFKENFGLETICLRYFNVYGPRQNPASDYAAVVPSFINACLNSEAITIYGDGNQTRDFIPVYLVAEANIAALKLALDQKDNIFNIGSGKAISINELATTVQELTNNSIPIRYQPARPGDPMASVADISAAQERLNLNPMGLVEGLKNTIDRWDFHGSVS